MIWGLLLEKKGEMMDLIFELLLVDYLDEIGALLMKLYQVSG